MNSYIQLFALLLAGFVIYYLLRDKIFDVSSSVEFESESKSEHFEVPAPTSIEIRQAPIYPPRNVSASGPNSPSQEPSSDIVTHNQPQPDDPYYESQDSSDINENLRYPERSFRPPPLNDTTSIAVEAGIASNTHQVSASNSQQFNTEFVQSGGEFMPGIFANDTFDDGAYSSF